jgi:hypothetical protein
MDHPEAVLPVPMLEPGYGLLKSYINRNIVLVVVTIVTPFSTVTSAGIGFKLADPSMTLS